MTEPLKFSWLSNYWLLFYLHFSFLFICVFLTFLNPCSHSTSPLFGSLEKEHDMKIHLFYHIQSFLLGKYIALLRTLPVNYLIFSTVSVGERQIMDYHVSNLMGTESQGSSQWCWDENPGAPAQGDPQRSQKPLGRQVEVTHPLNNS